MSAARLIHDAGVVTGAPGLYFVGLHFLYAMSSAMIHGVGARRQADRRTRCAAARARRAQCGPSRGSKLRAVGGAKKSDEIARGRDGYRAPGLGGGAPLLCGRGPEGAAAGRRPRALRACRRRCSAATTSFCVSWSGSTSSTWTAAIRRAPRVAAFWIGFRLAGMREMGAGERMVRARPAADRERRLRRAGVSAAPEGLPAVGSGRLRRRARRGGGGGRRRRPLSRRGSERVRALAWREGSCCSRGRSSAGSPCSTRRWSA